jgi:D-hydroxyproline dehydrogenase subunit alpha
LPHVPGCVRTGDEGGDRMTAGFDVVVVGAGPGGMAAATNAAEAGRRVCLLDDNTSPGGQIWRGFRAETATQYPHGADFVEWARRLERTRCEVWCGWQAIDHPQPRVLRVQRDGEVGDLQFERLILATGARELFLPFPGWTLPGVMGAGGLQALLKSGYDVRGKRVVVAGSGPLLLAVAAALKGAGATICGVYEQASLARLAQFGISLLTMPGKLAEGARYRAKTLGSPYRMSCWVTCAEGRGRAERVTITNGREEWRVECDLLACGFHLAPNLELPRLLGCRMESGFVAVDALQQSSVPGVACVGELTGIGGIEKALIEGEIAGCVAAGKMDRARALAWRRRRAMRFSKRLSDAFELRAELRKLAQPDTLICRCEDVPLAAIADCRSWREAKLHSRCGMGACQGRVCGAAAEFLFGWDVGGQRPPVFPTAVSAVAAEEFSS